MLDGLVDVWVWDVFPIATKPSNRFPKPPPFVPPFGMLLALLDGGVSFVIVILKARVQQFNGV